MGFYSQASTTPGQPSDGHRGPAYASSSYAPVGLNAVRPASKPGEKQSKPKPAKLRAGGGQVWEDKTLDDFDENDFRIFCGDLAEEVNDEALFNAFKRYPSIVKARVIREKHTGKSKGYGFVSFKNPNDFTKALREMNGGIPLTQGKYVGSRPIKLKKSSWKDRSTNIDQVRQIQQVLPKK